MKFTFKKNKIAAALAALAFIGSSSFAVAAPAHDKQVIGYLTQWEGWKGPQQGFDQQHVANHLNVDMDKYTILNYSFFGVAKDGSLHSGDWRNKQIYMDGSQQEPNVLMRNYHDSNDFVLLFGEVETISQFPWGFDDADNNSEMKQRLIAQGFSKHATDNKMWSHTSGLEGRFPLPLKVEGGAPGVIEKAHAKGIKVMASLGGWSMSKHFGEMAMDPTKKALFLADLEILMNLGFDGIDIDWEYPGHGGMNFTGKEREFKDFEDLMVDIRNVIGPDKLITAAFSASPAKLEGFDWARLDASMDYFNMMSYDYEGGWSEVAGHNAPLYNYDGSVDDTLNLDYLTTWMLEKGIAADKINLGMAFYGRGVQLDEAAALGAKTKKRQIKMDVDGPLQSAVDMKHWSKYEGSPSYFYIKQNATGWTEHFDEQARVPYLTKGDYFLSYDNEKSIKEKAQYISDQGLAGTIIWQVAGDLECKGSYITHTAKLKECTNLYTPLINAADEVFNASQGNRAPIVEKIAAITVKEGNVANIAVSARDPEGSALSYTWTLPAGVMGDQMAQNLTATFPVEKMTTTYDLKVMVSDGDKSTSRMVQVTVKGTETPVNNPPELMLPSMTASVDSEGSVDIAAGAADDDAQDTLTITADMGTVAQTANWAVITYQAPKVDVVTEVTINVMVSDGTDSVSKAVVVTVNPVMTNGDWDADTVYNTGDSVTWNGVKFTAKWWTKGQEPGKSGVWAEFDDGTVKEWRADKVYNTGDKAMLDGMTYEAMWWTKGNTPGNGAPWK